ncbi:universal stress protein [bacterium]|nr:universal stress protein [bacterium]
MKVLFCTDGSQISFDAIKNFALYSKAQTVIDIICVIDWHFYPMYMESPIRNYQNTYEEIADKILDFAQENINSVGKIVDRKIKVFGNIAEEILKQTKKQEYELIILGSHGKKGIRSWLGSVSREVINTTHKNVFLSKNNSQNKKILFTTDGSQNSEYVIQKAIDFLDFANSTIYLTYVQKDLNHIPIELKTNKTWLDKIQEQQKEETKDIIKTAKKVFEKNNLSISQEITLIGEPAEKILEINEEHNFDLIIMGSHSKNALQRLLLGSTSMRVLERAKNSVMIIYPRHK